MPGIIAAALIASAWLQGSALEDRSFDSNGVRIRYVDQGRGPAVVLIHGYTGNGDRHWVNTGVFASLAADHRAIAIDCRGHGMSGKPRDPAAYGAEMSRDVVRLLDHLHIRRAHVVGFSMGAFIAGHLMASEPDRLLSATLVAHHPIRTWTAADEREAEAEARDLESDTPFRSEFLAALRTFLRSATSSQDSRKTAMVPDLSRGLSCARRHSQQQLGRAT